MKTAVSIPDVLFRLAEKTAKKMGISRSHLFACAIEEYLQNHNPREITETLNALYQRNSSQLDKSLENMQTHSVFLEEW